ncbi:type IV pilus assembly protein PilK [Geopseudomonas sagittaria]|jgi:type IV pilus assembly protein PilK|uniref:protein-glutamate O-methyltransferase n=1 Tax=Geopseudomonas sagittaria TaxID=1135990 RepID=A0A1I5S6C2_9GAMM|nr:CheR family methyltransferase [Pseudomonas sagittaria]MCM2329849.1 protein-glutamate O-methyltransferase CheR [Pseudomonas sagittaria]SFP65796.1 type IV pilus assembly protein PilK [Pseudomonas sagittaria]
MQPSAVWAMKPLPDITAAEFRAWQELLETRSGIVLNEQRRAFLQTILATRLRELELDSYAGYYQQVTAGPRGAVEWSHLMDHLTVQETRFFRHPASFEHLAGYLRGRLLASPDKCGWQLWSVGCSSGEEVYSLALLAAEVQREAGLDGRFGVTGTDLSLSALERARGACYNPRRVGELAPELLERYFQAQDDGSLTVCDALRERVCFSRLNVLDLARAPQRGMDVIFCQNLLIYFRRWRRREILSRLVERLAPGGLLVIGVGEVADWSHPQLQPVADEQVLAFTRKG